LGEKMKLINSDDPRYAAAQKVINAMHDYFDLDPMGGAVRWIEDSDGRVIIFTRGEYRDAIRDLLNKESFVRPEEKFEAMALGENP
jgi:hypothetical protein